MIFGKINTKKMLFPLDIPLIEWYNRHINKRGSPQEEKEMEHINDVEYVLNGTGAIDHPFIEKAMQIIPKSMFGEMRVEYKKSHIPFSERIFASDLLMQIEYAAEAGELAPEEEWSEFENNLMRICRAKKALFGGSDIIPIWAVITREETIERYNNKKEGGKKNG